MTYEPKKWDRCPDCGTNIGNSHQVGCDVARCHNCGSQALSCGCDWDDPETWEEVWTGHWPGDLEAASMDLWSFWGPNYGLKGWQPCTAEHPGAGADLNAYYSVTRWDKESKTRVPR